MDAVSASPRWNHNTHYHPLILGAVPRSCRRSLDVGCGEGMLARDLRQVVPWVTGIDRDAASIELARRLDEDIEFIVGLARTATPPTCRSRSPAPPATGSTG
jgi:ubiquinone/menaquinone biosynthesis C-methylase UbiE